MTIPETARVSDTGGLDTGVVTDSTGDVEEVVTSVPHNPAYHLRAFDAPGSPASSTSRSATSLGTPQKQLVVAELQPRWRLASTRRSHVAIKKGSKSTRYVPPEPARVICMLTKMRGGGEGGTISR